MEILYNTVFILKLMKHHHIFGLLSPVGPNHNQVLIHAIYKAMLSEEEIQETIMKEFPHLKEKISELFYLSTSFIEICEDYALCLKTIHKAESMKEKLTEEDLYELRVVLLELKEELLSKIYIEYSQKKRNK